MHVDNVDASGIDTPRFNLQPLFDKPILQQKLFPDVHPGQASFVWLVETTSERRIVRTTRISETVIDPFWHASRALFGIHPTDVHAVQVINAQLGQQSTLAIPKVVRTPFLSGVPFAVVEELPGHTLRSFLDLPIPAVQELGRAIASIHGMQRRGFGNFRQSNSTPIREFSYHMANVMEDLVDVFYHGNAAIFDVAPDMIERAKQLDKPDFAVPILLDIDSTQFLTDGMRLTGLVDTEVYAWGPAQYDLVALEYLLDEERASAFQHGYLSVWPMPELKSVRPVYRFLQRLMEVQGAVPLDEWMNHPIWFD